MMLQRLSGTYKTSWRRRDPCEDTPEVLGERLVGISTVPIPSTGTCLCGLTKGELFTVDKKGVYVLNQPRSFATLIIQY
jgi:hypothetical protein